jgi:outer membrane protein
MHCAATWFARRRLARLLVVTVTACPLFAQESSSLPAAPVANTAVPPGQAEFQRSLKSGGYLPRLFGPYMPQHPGAQRLGNSPRLDQYLHDGKLYISINDAIALALENNLDLAIARINLKIADTDISRAESGSTISGVNAGVVQNTPGGGAGGLGGQVGSGEGGTSVGAGGAGAGIGGLVGSTLGSGSSISSFDPILTGSFQIDHLKSECNTPLCATIQNTGTANFSYSQGFHWGTDMTVDFNNSRVASNSVYNYLTPALTSSFQFRLNQHLLQGFGLTINTRYLQIAKNNRRISDAAFRAQIVVTVNQIENMYWDLVYAYENVGVQRKQLEFAERLLENNKKQMEIGSLASIEVVRAQSAIATDQQSLTVALTNLELAQLLMKNAITRTLDDPVLVDAEVIPTSTIELSVEEPAVPTQELVNEAFSHRPDLEEAFINLANSQISNKAIRNALLPTLDLSAYYGGAGLGGSQNPNYICIDNPQTCGLTVAQATLPPISYGSTLSQLVDSSAPDKGASLSLTIPIRNRAAQATQVRSELESQQSQLLIQQLENQIRIEVRNAQFGVQQNRASVEAAEAAVDFARQSLDAEQRKFDIRAATSISVLQNQTALTLAEATLISAKIAYEKAVVQLEQATGRLLDRAGISIVDAQRGQVTQAPNVPNVSTRPASQTVPEDNRPN